MNKKAKNVIQGETYITNYLSGYAKIYRDDDSGIVFVAYGRDGFPPHTRDRVTPIVQAVTAKMRSIADLRKWVEPRE